VINRLILGKIIFTFGSPEANFFLVASYGLFLKGRQKGGMNENCSV